MATTIPWGEGFESLSLRIPDPERNGIFPQSRRLVNFGVVFYVKFLLGVTVQLQDSFAIVSNSVAALSSNSYVLCE